MNDIDIQRLAERVCEMIETDDEAQFRAWADELAVEIQATIDEFTADKKKIGARK